jgi:hypothetical protein
MVEKPPVTIVATGGTAHTVIHLTVLPIQRSFTKIASAELDYHIALPMRKVVDQ